MRAFGVCEKPAADLSVGDEGAEGLRLVGKAVRANGVFATTDELYLTSMALTSTT